MIRARGIRIHGVPARAGQVLRLVALTLALAAVLGPAPAAAAAGTAPRASLTAIENDVMCVLCHEPLAVAQSPESYSERDYIRTLILQGETQQQIEKNLVAQYGPAVLALPPAHGFNLLVYVVPPVLLALGIALLAVTIPRWRRRSRLAGLHPLPVGPALDPIDARRLDADLARRP